MAENVEIVKRGFAAFEEGGLDAYNRRDQDGFVAMRMPDCEWHPFLTARVEGDTHDEALQAAGEPS
jgi:ketosteroid isomerase-like protein